MTTPRKLTWSERVLGHTLGDVKEEKEWEQLQLPLEYEECNHDWFNDGVGCCVMCLNCGKVACFSPLSWLLEIVRDSIKNFRARL